MLGRGILACPDLARQIKTAAGQQTVKPLSWMQVLILVEELLRIEAAMYPAKHACNRVKQWLSYLRYGYYQAGPLFEDIKRLQTTTAIAGVLTRHRSLTAATEHHSNEIILQ